MSTKSVPAKKTETALATPPPNWGDYAGEGFENTTRADLQIPFLAILQAQSPQVTDDDAKLPGAEPGKFFNTVTGEVYDPPVYLVPCYKEHKYVEWVPRDKGGGFRGALNPDDPVVQEALARLRREGRELVTLSTKSGNLLKETFYLYCLVLAAPDSTTPKEFVALAFSSTSIGPYKKLMTMLKMVQGRPPMFSFVVAATTFNDKNEKGRWKNWAFAPAVGKTLRDSQLPAPSVEGVHPLLPQGRDLRDMVKSGAAEAAYETAEEPREVPAEDVTDTDGGGGADGLPF